MMYQLGSAILEPSSLLNLTLTIGQYFVPVTQQAYLELP